MTRFLLATSVAIALAASPALAEEFDQACKLAAAERLPRIPGIEIVGEPRLLPLPPEVAKQVDQATYQRLVEVDAKAAGQTPTFRFFCVAVPGAPVMIGKAP